MSEEFFSDPAKSIKVSLDVNVYSLSFDKSFDFISTLSIKMAWDLDEY